MTDGTTPTSDTQTSRRKPLVVALIVAALFAIPLAGVVLTGAGAESRAAKDQDRYHLVASQRFAEQWPAFEFGDYESATTPGYHVVVATFIRFATGDKAGVRLFASFFTFGLIVTLAMAVGRRAPPLLAVCLCAPLIASQYVFQAGAFMLPDNAGWWGVLALVLLAYYTPWCPRVAVAGGVILAALVATRQIHLWGAGVVWLAAWLGNLADGESSGPLLTNSVKRSVGRTAFAFAMTAPAFLIVFWFYKLWGDALTPPLFQVGGDSERAGAIGNIKTTGGNPATPATVLSIAGGIGILYLPVCIRQLLEMWLERRTKVLQMCAIGAAIGLLAGAIPLSTFSMEAGRWSGIWNIVNKLPVIADRSPLIIALSTLGGFVIVATSLALHRRDRWVFLATWAGFIVAMSANAQAWQRYYEPFAIMMFALAAARAQGDRIAPRWALAGPIALALGSAALTMLSLR